MRILFIIISLFIKSQGYSQSTETRKLSITIVDGKEPFRAATLYVANSNPPRGAMTDINGTATLKISNEDQKIIVTPFYQPIELTNFQTSDSIHINLKKGKIRYFNHGKRIGKPSDL